MRAFVRYLLLEDWSNTRRDPGAHVFRLGKGIGIVGRVLGVVIVPVAVIGSMVSPTVLFFAGYGAALAALLLLAAELCARLLMLAGNALSFQGRQRDRQ